MADVSEGGPRTRWPGRWRSTAGAWSWRPWTPTSTASAWASTPGTASRPCGASAVARAWRTASDSSGTGWWSWVGWSPWRAAHNQAAFPCGDPHGRPLRFLLMQAVEKAPDYSLPDGPVKDTRSGLMLDVAGAESGGRWVYRISARGEAPNVAARVRAVASGFRRYGEAEVVGEGEVSFPCGCPPRPAGPAPPALRPAT